MKGETDESDTDGSSVEGEYSVAGFESPRFSFNSWSPEAPAGLHFMCLVPIGGPSNKAQQKSPGKIKVSQSNRQQRVNAFKTAKTEKKYSHGEKKLRQASTQNDYSTVVELLEVGVDPRSQDEKGRTALHFAAAQGHEMIVKILIERGADVNQTDILDNTPLHLAAVTCQVPIVTLLLKAGPDLQLVNKYGTTPVTLAKNKLKFLSESEKYSSQDVRKEVAQVSEMMKTFLNLSGLKSESEQVDELCQQLEKTTTREEVDNISSLLANFTNMTLQHNNQQPPQWRSPPNS